MQINNKTAFRILVLSGVCVAALTSCSWVRDWPPDSVSAAEQEQGLNPAPPPPQARLVQTADSTWLEPMGAPPVSKAVPELPHHDAGPALERIKTLEDEVSSMRSDMKMMVPVMAKMAEAQSQMQQVLVAQSRGQAQAAQAQQQAGVGITPAQPMLPPAEMASRTGAPVAAYDPYSNGNNTVPVQAYGQMPQSLLSPSPAATMPQQVATAPAAVMPGAEIRQVRFGEHPGRSRIVFDASDKVTFSYDLDNAEHILMIDLPGTGWSAGRPQGVVSGSPLVASWQAEPDRQGGTRMIIRLRKAAQVVTAQNMTEDNGRQPRLVIDLAPL